MLSLRAVGQLQKVFARVIEMDDLNRTGKMLSTRLHRPGEEGNQRAQG